MDTETIGHRMILRPTLGKGESGVHSFEEQYAWLSGDGTTLFGLEVRTPIIEEAQNKEET